MKLKDLTVELSGNDNARPRSLNIGPFSDGLNFIYGERGAGKSTLRNQIGELLLDSVCPSSVERTSIGCNSIAVVVEHNANRYRISRDASGFCTSTKMNSMGAILHSDESLHQLPALERELMDNLAFVAFRDSKSKLAQLHQILQKRYQVPLGPDAACEANDTLRIQQQRFDLQSKIEILQLELTQLQSQRASVEAEINASRSHSLAKSSEIDLQIRDLTARLTELDPARIRLEVDTLQREATRLKLEIQNSTTVVRQATPSPYLPTLYRLLDEIDQQIREVRTVQSNVQRHRVKLKDEMEFRNGLTVEQENHPYHRAREILRQIEGRIDDADFKGDQWVEDHGTLDAQQVSRFLDETGRAIRDDLQHLCDELSTQYQELRNRSATHELKELRQNYTHLSELIQQILARREKVLIEIQIADAPGADAIHRADPEFCLLASCEGHLAARQRFIGPIDSVEQHARTTNSSDTSLQQQQLAAVESRIATLQATSTMAQLESEPLTLQLGELNLQKSSLSTLTETQSHSRLAQYDSRINTLGSEISARNLQLSQFANHVVAPNPLLATAGNILKHLTRGDFTRVWLSSVDGVIEVRDRNSRSFAVNNLTERGLSQLVQLSLVLAANENGISLTVPLILDDLFADLEKDRIDETLETITRWCQQTFHQVIVLTQHRFLADRVPEASVWEIEPESNSENWRPATRESLAAVENVDSKPVLQSWEIQRQDTYAAPPVAEYPVSPLPRPYPLSKYPRTSDRERASEFSEFADFESYVQPEIPAQTVAMDQRESVQRATVTSPSAIGDRYNLTTVNESDRIDSLGLLDNGQLRCLADNGIADVNEFLILDSEQESPDFASCYLTGESLEHLHASAWLMMWVPGLAANDAQALVACGISDPEHLLTSNIESLFERVARFLRSPDGRRFGTSGRTLTRDTVDSWQQRLRGNRNYRQQSRSRYRSENRPSRRRHALRAWSPQDRSNSREHDAPSRSNEPSVRQTVERDVLPAGSPRMRAPENREPRRSAPPIPPRAPRSDSPRKPVAVRQAGGRQALRKISETSTDNTTKHSDSKSAAKVELPTPSKLRFYLELTDHIEAAPSIGAKTGARFEAIGVITIADFLKMTAESLAEKLDYKRLNSKVLRQGQHQTRLVCRIPNLRGHDAQLLVGCGIVEAEEIASMRPESLFAKVAPFSDTKEGLKIIRNGKKPDLAEITDWISFAQHNRSLRAA